MDLLRVGSSSLPTVDIACVSMPYNDYGLARQSTVNLQGQLFCLLIRGGEFIIGSEVYLDYSAVSDDEEGPDWLSMVDQTALGHRLIVDAFGTSALPNVTWQIGKKLVVLKQWITPIHVHAPAPL